MDVEAADAKLTISRFHFPGCYALVLLDNDLRALSESFAGTPDAGFDLTRVNCRFQPHNLD